MLDGLWNISGAYLEKKAQLEGFEMEVSVEVHVMI
jgi:hypothetical protein